MHVQVRRVDLLGKRKPSLSSTRNVKECPINDIQDLLLEMAGAGAGHALLS